MRRLALTLVEFKMVRKSTQYFHRLARNRIIANQLVLQRNKFVVHFQCFATKHCDSKSNVYYHYMDIPCLYVLPKRTCNMTQVFDLGLAAQMLRIALKLFEFKFIRKSTQVDCKLSVSCIVYTHFCLLRADLTIRLATHRNSVDNS